MATKKKKKPDGDVCYCRKCQQYKSKNKTEFYSASDNFLDTNGFMSVCKQCISEMYINLYTVEHNFERVIFKLCKSLNILYNDSAVAITKKMLAGKEIGEENPSAFGIYRGKLPVSVRAGLSGSSNVTGLNMESMDLTFKYESKMPEIHVDNSAFADVVDLKDFWGENLTVEDYRFLEKEYNNFKQTHRAEVYSEIILLKEVCYKLLAMNNARLEGKSSAVLTKELQEILKNLAISPAMLNTANSGKNLDTFGNWVKDIENFRPAEFFKDKKLYKDFDNMEEYAERHITRPLKNFITGSRDFGADSLDEVDDFDDGDE